MHSITFRVNSRMSLHIQSHSGGVQYSHKGTHVHSMGVHGVFTQCSHSVHTHSKAFMCSQWVFRGVQYSLKGIHVHSIAFRGCSILTQRCSCAISHVQGVLNYVPYSLKGGKPSKAQWIYRPYRFALNFISRTQLYGFAKR